MWEIVEALIPPFAMAAVFVAIAVTAFRATDGKRRRNEDEDGR